MKTPYKHFWLYAAGLPIIVIILDQLTKLWATKTFKVPFNICEINPYPNKFQDMGPIVDLALVCNQGVSFGLLGGDSSLKRWLLTLFALLMCGILFYALTRTKDTLSRLGIGLIIGGAIGNGIDRALFGAVTDFISVGQLLPFFPWVFNIADSAITCGVIALLLASFLNPPDKKAAKD